MRRLLHSVPFAVLAALLGTSAGFAQSPSASATTQPSSAADQVKEKQSDKEKSTDASTFSRQEAAEIRQEAAEIMLGTGAGLERDAAPKTVSLQLSDKPLSPVQEANGNRRIYYIIGGALVAGGLVAGILALDGGDGGADGIPPPPGRPPQ